MPLPSRRFCLLAAVLVVAACSFDKRPLGPADAAAALDGDVVTDGRQADVRADSAREDGHAPADLGASDVGASDRQGDASCAPQCSGKPCGAADGCGGTCQAGSDCCTPQCDRAVCGGHDGCGGTCHGDNGDPCGAAPETWRCIFIDTYGTWGAQVCRGGTWQTYSLSPRSCSGCCGIYSPDCCPTTGCNS